MTDEDVFRQQNRNKIKAEDVGDSPKSNLQNSFNETSDQMKSVRDVQNAAARETGSEVPAALNESIEIKGNVPAAFQQAMANRNASVAEEYEEEDQPNESVPEFEAAQAQGVPKRIVPKKKPKPKLRTTGSDSFEDAIRTLQSQSVWEEFEWPSLGRFYEGIPPVVHVRPMTGEEEQILATPRFVRRGKAIDMIFAKCIRENIDTTQLLSVDRTHLLIYLRGISYTPEYDVEIKCPDCTNKFSTIIDLNMLEVSMCPSDFDGEDFEGELPSSGFSYQYRLSTGADELAITNYREKRIQQFGDATEDDTLLYRTAMLLEHIEGVTDKRELNALMKKLPIADVAHLRNEINEPPFGVNTEVEILCPICTSEFDIDLPLETNFFFPRKKAVQTQA